MLQALDTMKRKTIILRLLNVMLTVLFSFSLAAALTIIPSMIGFGWPYSSSVGSVLAVFSWTFGLIAWAILIVMGVAWAFEKKLHKSVPITGTVIGTISVLPWIPTVLPIIVLTPALVLATRLVFYHLNHPKGRPAG